jgi:hypothetical protein
MLVYGSEMAAERPNPHQKATMITILTLIRGSNSNVQFLSTPS